MNIIIAGDLVPTKSNEDIFSKGEVSTLLCNKLDSVWKEADVRIFNLESPLTDKYTPIKKRGPKLRASTATIRGIKELNPSLLTLANNHILDQGELGLTTTQRLLNENNIPFIGVGKNLQNASEPYIIELNGLKIGIYACAAYEFSIATEKLAGANPFDPLESLEHIYRLKSKCDYVIVLYHAGKEHYRYPSPYLQKVCRKMVDKGADLIVCQHSHCIGSFEKYKNSTIVYGQGNFLFDKSNSEFWKTSILVSVKFLDNPVVEFIALCKDEHRVRLANENERETILNNLYTRSENILKDGFIEEEYRRFALKNRSYYLAAFAGFGRLGRKLNALLNNKILDTMYSNSNLLTIESCIQCEDHRELMMTFLRNNRYEEDKLDE